MSARLFWDCHRHEPSGPNFRSRIANGMKSQNLNLFQSSAGLQPGDTQISSDLLFAIQIANGNRNQIAQVGGRGT